MERSTRPEPESPRLRALKEELRDLEWRRDRRIWQMFTPEERATLGRIRNLMAELDVLTRRQRRIT